MSSSTMGRSTATGPVSQSQGVRQQQQQQPFYTGVQPAGKPRMINRKTERFEPFPNYDVLLSSPHRNYLTTANHAYIALKPRRSQKLNLLAEVKEPLHRVLKASFGFSGLARRGASYRTDTVRKALSIAACRDGPKARCCSIFGARFSTNCPSASGCVGMNASLMGCSSEPKKGLAGRED